MDADFWLKFSSLLFTGLAFFAGRLSTAKNDSSKWGKLEGEITSDLRHLQEDIRYIRTAVDANAKATDAAMKALRESTRDSIRRLHDRFDDHLRKEHKMPIPKVNN